MRKLRLKMLVGRSICLNLNTYIQLSYTKTYEYAGNSTYLSNCNNDSSTSYLLSLHQRQHYPNSKDAPAQADKAVGRMQLYPCCNREVVSLDRFTLNDPKSLPSTQRKEWQIATMLIKSSLFLELIKQNPNYNLTSIKMHYGNSWQPSPNIDLKVEYCKK